MLARRILTMGAVRIRHSFIRSPPPAARSLYSSEFSTRGEEASPRHRLPRHGAPDTDGENKPPIQQQPGSGRGGRAARGNSTRRRHSSCGWAGARGRQQRFGEPPSSRRPGNNLPCPTSLPSTGATPQEHSRASDPRPPQSFCLIDRCSAQLARSSRLGQCLSRCQEPGLARGDERRGGLEPGRGRESKTGSMPDRSRLGRQGGGKGENITPIT